MFENKIKFNVKKIKDSSYNHYQTDFCSIYRENSWLILKPHYI